MARLPLVALLLALMWRAETASAAPTRPVIVFFGDSLTAGLHASAPDHAFAQLLAARLTTTRDDGPAFAFIEDPVGLLDDAQAKVPLVLAARPSLVFLELGHHEVWSDEHQLEMFKARYSDIVDRLLRGGADVIPSTLAWLGFEPGTFEYDAALWINATIRRLADERGLIVADFWTPTDLRPELLSTPEDVSFIAPYEGDNLHPNDAGHRMMAEAFWQAYRELRRRSGIEERTPV